MNLLEISPEQAIIQSQCVLEGEFVLSSTAKSSFYYDLRNLRSFPKFKEVIVNHLQRLILSKGNFDLLADVPTGATALVASLSDRLVIPQITPWPERRTHGSGTQIDGIFYPGQRAILIEDTINSGGSIETAARTLRDHGLVVDTTVVVVDREAGGIDRLASLREPIHVFAITTGSKILEARRRIIQSQSA